MIQKKSGDNKEKEDDGIMASIKERWDGLTQKAKDLQTYGESYKCFAILFVIACFFFFMSLCFLPVFFLMPRKTATFFNLAMIIMLIAFGK